MNQPCSRSTAASCYRGWNLSPAIRFGSWGPARPRPRIESDQTLRTRICTSGPVEDRSLTTGRTSGNKFIYERTDIATRLKFKFSNRKTSRNKFIYGRTPDIPTRLNSNFQNLCGNLPFSTIPRTSPMSRAPTSSIPRCTGWLSYLKTQWRDYEQFPRSSEPFLGRNGFHSTLHELNLVFYLI